MNPHLIPILTLAATAAAHAADLTLALDTLKHNSIAHVAVARIVNAGGQPYSRIGVDCAFLKAGKAQAVGQGTAYAVPAQETVFLEIIGPVSAPGAIDEARCRISDARKEPYSR
jgi:hypothetical protein